MTDTPGVSDKHSEGARELARYWSHGEGAAKIGWGTPGAYERCVVLLSEHMSPEQAHGYCAVRHHDATGSWPGRGHGVNKAAHTGGMIALLPDAPSKHALAGGLPAEDLHVTLVYLGDVSGWSEQVKRDVLDAVSTLANAFALDGAGARLQGIGIFVPETGPLPVWASVDIAGLAAYRTALWLRLESVLAEHGISLPDDHDFTPHMTLAYAEDEAAAQQAIAAYAGLGDCPFSNLAVAFGDTVQAWPLTPAVSKAAGSGEAADLSSLLAKADSSKRFTLAPWYVPDSLDSHKEWSDAEEIQKALWGYVRKGDRRIRLQHIPEIVAGEWLEAMTWPFEVTLPMTKADGTTADVTYPPNTTFLGVHWEDWAWPLVLKGKITGLSIGGRAKRIRGVKPGESVEPVTKHGDPDRDVDYFLMHPGTHQTPKSWQTLPKHYKGPAPVKAKQPADAKYLSGHPAPKPKDEHAEHHEVSGLPKHAPAHAKPVTSTAQVHVGDRLYLKHYPEPYHVEHVDHEAGTVHVKTKAGKVSTVNLLTEAAKGHPYAVEHTDASAASARAKFISEHMNNPLPSSAPGLAVGITEAHDAHPGDTLYLSGSDKPWQVLGHTDDGKVMVQGANGKKYAVSPAAKGKKYAVVPGPDKGHHLLGISDSVGDQAGVKDDKAPEPKPAAPYAPQVGDTVMSGEHGPFQVMSQDEDVYYLADANDPEGNWFPHGKGATPLTPVAPASKPEPVVVAPDHTTPAGVYVSETTGNLLTVEPDGTGTIEYGDGFSTAQPVEADVVNNIIATGVWNQQAPSEPKVGDKVTVTGPQSVAPAGTTGTLTYVDDYVGVVTDESGKKHPVVMNEVKHAPAATPAATPPKGYWEAGDQFVAPNGKTYTVAAVTTSAEHGKTMVWADEAGPGEPVVYEADQVSPAPSAPHEFKPGDTFTVTGGSGKVLHVSHVEEDPYGGEPKVYSIEQGSTYWYPSEVDPHTEPAAPSGPKVYVSEHGDKNLNVHPDGSGDLVTWGGSAPLSADSVKHLLANEPGWTEQQDTPAPTHVAPQVGDQVILSEPGADTTNVGTVDSIHADGSVHVVGDTISGYFEPHELTVVPTTSHVAAPAPVESTIKPSKPKKKKADEAAVVATLSDGKNHLAVHGDGTGTLTLADGSTKPVDQVQMKAFHASPKWQTEIAAPEPEVAETLPPHLQAGAVVASSKFPGNTYKVLEVKDDKAIIQTQAGSQFSAPTADLKPIGPGDKVKVGGTGEATVTSVDPDGKIHLDNGAFTTAGDIAPATATPGKGVAAGASQASTSTGSTYHGGGKYAEPYIEPFPQVPHAYGSTVMTHAQGARTFSSEEDGVHWGTFAYAMWRERLLQGDYGKSAVSAIHSYTGSGYSSMNTKLRTGAPLTGHAAAAAKALNAAEVPEDIILSRGTSLYHLDQSKVGQVLFDRGFQSTSASPIAAFSSHSTILRIRVPKGSKGAYLGDGPHSSFGNGEREFLLPPGAAYRIDALHQVGGKTIADVTLVGQGLDYGGGVQTLKAAGVETPNGGRVAA